MRIFTKQLKGIPYWLVILILSLSAISNAEKAQAPANTLTANSTSSTHTNAKANHQTNTNNTVNLVTSSLRYESSSFSVAQALLAEISKRSGIHFTLSELPSKRAEEELMRGNFAGDIGRIYQFGEQHPNLIRITEAVAHLPQYVYSFGKPFKIDGWRSLKPHRAVVIHGHLFVEKYMADVDKVRAHNVEHALRLLKNGRADIFVASPFLAEDVIRSNLAISNGIHRLEPMVAVLKQYTYFLPQYNQAAKRFQETLVAMKQDGSYQRLIRRMSNQLIYKSL